MRKMHEIIRANRSSEVFIGDNLDRAAYLEF
jgi:hypothetical protein